MAHSQCISVSRTFPRISCTRYRLEYWSSLRSRALDKQMGETMLFIKIIKINNESVYKYAIERCAIIITHVEMRAMATPISPSPSYYNYYYVFFNTPCVGWMLNYVMQTMNRWARIIMASVAEARYKGRKRKILKECLDHHHHHHHQFNVHFHPR